MQKRRIAMVSELTEGKTAKFQITRNGRLMEGFVACFKGQFVAYENRCRHLPLSLDYDDGRFFSRDGQHFVCQTHNAVYEPLTGLCVRGPCEGDSLKPLKIEVVKDEIWLLD